MFSFSSREIQDLAAEDNMPYMVPQTVYLIWFLIHILKKTETGNTLKIIETYVKCILAKTD